MASFDEIHELVELCRPAFTGRHPGVQGAALCDLLSIWLHGHTVAGGDAAATEQLRNELLANHIESVRALVALKDAAP